MSYLVCYKCDVYYEVETEEEIRELTHCVCGEKLLYFENLEDSYADGDKESLYEALSQVDDTFVDLGETNDTEPGEVNNKQEQEKIANGKTYTQKKVSQYEQIQDHGQLVTYAGALIFIISFLALLTTLNFIYLILTLAGVLLSVYGNKLINKSQEEGYSWQKGNKGEIIVADYLDTLPEDYFIFNDVKLPGKGGNIDHVVIGPTGIYVIETKNYSGKYRIKGNQWLYYKNGQAIEIKKNPGTQVRKNTRDLINFLNKKGISTSGSWITGLVALICPDFRVLETPQNYRVLLPKTVPNYIMKGKKESNTQLLGKAAMELKPYSVELTFTHR
jgi:hypothetical protein